MQKNRIPYKEQKIVFPERIVVGVKANKRQLSKLQIESSRITEIRKMVTPTSFFIELSQSEQREWAKDLEKDLIYPRCLILLSVCWIQELITAIHF